MPGPLPNPAARRRNTGAALTTLPAGGRSGPPPAWPIPVPAGEDPARTALRARLWGELWALPVAVLWEREGEWLAVCVYLEEFVRWSVDPAAFSVSRLAELRHLAQALKLTSAGLQRARVRIGEDPAGPPPWTPRVIDLSDWSADDDGQDDDDAPPSSKLDEGSDLDDGAGPGWASGPAC